ncbi:MAG: chromosomal replication initiator protein DnaA [Phycisphaerales bacterium]|nr:MAG: chromosomal replication initiator protein DnaA [Phycisphaerales bacterium]
MPSPSRNGPGAFNREAWGQVLARLRAEHHELLRGWFGQLVPEQLNGGTLHIRAANPAQVEYLKRFCGSGFAQAVQAVTGRLIAVHFYCNNHNGQGLVEGSLVSHAFPLSFETSSLRLNPEYTFENFVTGPCNRLAHAAAIAVGDAPGQSYNPLFIHGDVGLGKTHLLQGICHTVDHGHQPANILYLTGEDFTNHFLEAVECGALHSFRDRYRHVDVLVIDDIQFLAERERSQEEFFHTFNALYQEQKQIVLASDAPPNEIPTLEERLVSRFNWGLVARIDKPCLETRMAILRKKARLRCIDLPESVVHLVASRIVSNTRELEGAITKLDLLSQQIGGVIDDALAAQAVNESPQVPPPNITIAHIIDVVARHYRVKVSDIQGKRRTKSITLPRQVCMYLARKLTTLSLGEIGGYFGGRDHTTVLHARQKVLAAAQNDKAFQEELEALAEQIKRGV